MEHLPRCEGVNGNIIMRTYQIWGYVMEVRGLNSIGKCINGIHSENKYQRTNYSMFAQVHACLHTCKHSCYF